MWACQTQRSAVRGTMSIISSSIAVQPMASTSRNVAGRSLFTSAVRNNSPWEGPVSNKPMNRYIVIAEDYPNPGALARRLEAREQHMADARKGVEAGRIELAGGLLSKDFKDIDSHTSPVHSLCGSMFVVHGESLDDVRQRVMTDEYARASAWDPSRIKIFPFLPAFLQPAAETPTLHEQVEAVTRRTPYGVSQRRAKTIARHEVFINDPRSTGAALNTQDRKLLGQSLSALRRNGHSTASVQQQQQEQRARSAATLDSLRKNYTPPQ